MAVHIPDCIREEFSDAKIIRRRCEEQGCRIEIDGQTDYVVLKGEQICQKQSICDCIIFMQDCICLVELKSKTVHATEIREKLNNGLRLALDILEQKCKAASTKFPVYLVVLAKAWNVTECKKIGKTKIEFKGISYQIKIKRCGVSFSELRRNK